MKSSLLTGFWILSMFELSATSTVNICSTDSASKQIDCGEGALITIQEATAIYNQPLVCGPNINGLGGNPSARCRNQQKEIFRRCYGRESCEVKPADAILQLSGGCGSSTANFLYVEYFCLPVPNNSKARLPISGDVTAGTLHIFSPRFPNAMPPGQYSFSCRISPMVSLGEDVTLRVGKNVLIMNATSTNGCAERLEIYSMLPGTTDCNPQENWGEELTFEVRGSVTMTYRKMSFTYGGIFWIVLRAVDASNTRVRLKIECPDQGQIPGYSPPTTITSSLTPDTTEDISTSPIATTEYQFSSVDVVTEAVTSGGVTVSTEGRTETLDRELLTNENEDKGSGSGGLIGGLVGGFLVVIVAVVAVAVFLGVKLRKFEREKRAAQAGSPSNKNTAVVAALETYETIPDYMVIIDNRNGHPYPTQKATDNGAYEEVKPSATNIPKTSRQQENKNVTMQPGSNLSPAMPDVTENTPGQQYDDVADPKQYEPLAMVQYENTITQPKVYASLSPEAVAET